jgi:hypothetical protein
MDESLQGGPELVPAGGARCATHPEVRATTTCERCGNFVCNACYDVLPDGRAVCEPCHALVGNLSIPWERADLPWLKRFGRTVTEVVLTPGMTLGRVGEGDACGLLRRLGTMGAMWPAVAVLNLFGAVPVVGFVPQLVALGLMLLWPPVALHEVAKGVHGLSGIKAVAPALFPLIVLTAMGCLCLIPAALLDT